MTQIPVLDLASVVGGYGMPVLFKDSTGKVTGGIDTLSGSPFKIENGRVIRGKWPGATP